MWEGIEPLTSAQKKRWEVDCGLEGMRIAVRSRMVWGVENGEKKAVSVNLGVKIWISDAVAGSVLFVWRTKHQGTPDYVHLYTKGW